MNDASTATSATRTPLTVAVWVWVGVPFLYGVYSLLTKIPALFGS